MEEVEPMDEGIAAVLLREQEFKVSAEAHTDLEERVLVDRFPHTVAAVAAAQELPMRDVRLQILSLDAISRVVAAAIPAAERVRRAVRVQTMEPLALRLISLEPVAAVAAARFLAEVH